MKKSLYILGLAALSVMASGCDKEFLEVEPNQNISPEQIEEEAKKDPTLLNAYLAGIYSTIYTTGTGGTTGHDDFGQKGYDIYSDMIASDMVLAGVTYGWYSTVARYQATQDFSQNPAYLPWRYYYRIIFAANGLIELLEQDPNLSVPASRALGQAKALRAYSYFYLAQFYAEKGYGTGSEKILPIYTSTKVPAQPKSTSAEVYNLIISDLTDAVTRLEGYSRPATAKFEINQSVAKGLLSYALMARGSSQDLTLAAQLTDEVIATGGFRLLEKDEVVAQFDASGAITNANKAGFNNVASPSWMWGMDLVLDYGLNLISWWGQVDVFSYSYAWAGDPKTIDRGLYDAIRADDVRKGQFHPTNLQPRNKFFHPDRVIGGQRFITTDYVYMRIEEMYLLNAEAKAKLGQDEPARERLKALLAKRVTDNSYVDDLSGQALVNEIYLQTRIEMWGEGKSYLALKRNKATVTRGSNHLFNAGESFAWDSPLLSFPIPQAEVINNPVLNN
jgi:starch-binding outer membrane protein, SusD/RagB family